MNLGLDELLRNNHDFKKLNPSLENIKQALDLFDNPQDDFESIIVAGTNGKGSVCTLLEQLYLKYTDLKIAKFTSPHLISVTERIQIQSSLIPEDDLAQILNEIKERIDFELSYFEKLSLASFVYFSRKQVDLAIVEVGMGGRWDCANVISDSKRKATIITSIGLDHTEYLGDSLEKIRIEKEAIKRSSVPHFDYKDYDFIGSAEERNYQLALEVFKKMLPNKNLKVEKKFVLDAFKGSYQARFQHLSELNAIIDSAHNPDAAVALNQYLKEKFNSESIEMHLAFLDKDYISFFKSLSLDLDVKKVCVYQLEADRAADADKVLNDLSKLHKNLKFEKAQISQIKKTQDLKVYTGSIYFSGELLKLVAK